MTGIYFPYMRIRRRGAAKVMGEPERPNFNLVDLETFMVMGEDEDEDVLEVVLQRALQEIYVAKNVRTRKKIGYWTEKVEDGAKKLGLNSKSIIDLENITLNTVLTSFTLSMKRLNGSNFQVATVHNMLSCVVKYLPDGQLLRQY